MFKTSKSQNVFGWYGVDHVQQGIALEGGPDLPVSDWVGIQHHESHPGALLFI